MIRKLFKKNNNPSKLDEFIKRYKIPREYLSINRKSVTRGLLVGLFWSFIPMPMQMLAVIFTIPFFKYNVPLALGAVWISNPVTMPFMYYFEYLTGSFLLGLDSLNAELTIKWFKHNLDNIFIPLYVGAFFYSITISLIVYYIINWLWIHSVRHEKRHQKRKDNKNKKH